MKFKLIDEFNYEYKNVNNINEYQKNIINWIITQKYYSTFIKDIKIIELSNTLCIITLYFNYKSKLQYIKIHIQNNEVNYETLEELDFIIKNNTNEFKTNIDFLNYIINIIQSENHKYYQEIQNKKNR